MADGIISSASDWYNKDIGRDADASGLAYWNNLLAQPGADVNAIHQAFDASAVQNGEFNTTKTPATTAATAEAVPATATGYTAQQLNVTPDMTVQGQLQSITDPNSPIIQQARTQGLQNAAARGLTNSSIAQTGADAAVYAAATPIAQQDANTYLGAGTLNTNSVNTANQFGAAAQNTANLQNSSLGTQTNQFNANAANTLTGQNITANTSKYVADTNATIAALGNDNKITLQQMQNSNAQLLQTDTAAQQSWTNAMGAINNIQNNTSMDATTKTAAINNIAETLQNALTAMGKINGLNLDGLVTFSAANAVPTTTDPLTASGLDAKGNPIGTTYDANGNKITATTTTGSQ